MKILGVGGSVHDYSYCIVEDGMFDTFIEEERFSRERYAQGKRSLSFQGLSNYLRYKGMTLKDIDYIVTNSLMPLPLIELHFGDRFLTINHHMGHAASVYYTSGFDSAAIFVADGSGSEDETVSFGVGDEREIYFIWKYFGKLIPQHKLLHSNVRFHSYGEYYNFFTKALGFHMLQAGKTMGLAPYGRPTYLEKMRRFFYIDENNIFQTRYDDPELAELLTPLIHGTTGKGIDAFKEDIAFAVQHILEECILNQLNHLYKITKRKNLCLSGGVALNSSLNTKILKQTPFEDIYIFPSAGDAGIALGEALYVYYQYFQKNYQKRRISHAYWGLSHTTDDILNALAKYEDRIIFEFCDEEKLLQSAATALQEGKIIGWFQGKSEIGPRALGHRSILADARIADMKDILNNRIKFRESFRPFAPSVLEERATEYFELGTLKSSPFMLFVVDVKEEKWSNIPAVTHIDKTSRIQTVNEKDNGIFYKLIKQFEKETGCPLVLNTSFNIRGEPIVESPEDALRCFTESDLDMLFLENYIIKKKSEEKEASIDIQAEKRK